MNHSPHADPSPAGIQMTRRGVLRAGGISIALAGLLAACADEPVDDKPARVGSVPPLPVLPEGVVSDGVVFRTAMSMHYSYIDAHNISKKLGQLTDAQTATIDNFIQAHKDAIQDLAVWTEKAGAVPWECANARFDRVTLVPIADHITGRPKQGTEEVDIPPSDDPNRDCIGLSTAIENLCCAMHQSFVQTFSLPEYRAESCKQGQLAGRRAAVIALQTNPANIVNRELISEANPGASTTTTIPPETTTTVQNIAQPSDGVTTTTAVTVSEVQVWYAIPSQFGSLSAVQLAVGAPSSGGTQFTINMETPSLNSYIYNYMTECE